MSYEGYEEYLTEKGYYFQTSCYEDNPKTGPNNDPVKYTRSVNVTNGYGEQQKMEKHGGAKLEEGKWYYDKTAPKIEIGFDDVWHEDHYGNKYATKLMRYKPADNRHWRKL